MDIIESVMQYYDDCKNSKACVAVVYQNAIELQKAASNAESIGLKTEWGDSDHEYWCSLYKDYEGNYRVIAFSQDATAMWSVCEHVIYENSIGLARMNAFVERMVPMKFSGVKMITFEELMELYRPQKIDVSEDEALNAFLCELSGNMEES